MGWRLLLRKEVRALFREPMVVLMIIMPFIIYGGMSPFYKGAVEQVEKAARLKGVTVAVAGCGGAGYQAARIVAERLQKAGVEKVYAVESCHPGRLVERYDVVLFFNATSLEDVLTGRASIAAYVRGDVSKLTKTLALPSAVMAKLSEALSGGAKVRVRMESLIYLKGRFWSYNQLNNLYGLASTFSYATFFILFPAASLGAALIGAEREERMLEVLFSLPIRRRDIALAKALAAIIAAVLTAASALAGIYMLLSRGLAQQLGGITSYYGVKGIGLYVAALALEALFVTSLAMIVGLFTTSVRGAQSASMIAVFPALIPPFLLITGVPVSLASSAAPYMAAVLASLYPIVETRYILASIVFQAVETGVALLALIRMLESELAVTGPETLKRLLRRLRERRRSTLSLLARKT